MGKLTQIFRKTSEDLEDSLPEPFKPVARDVKVKMLVSTHGSPDGIEVLRYEKGKTYQVSENLARLFVEAGLAERV